eukprot:2885068-Alexandrium_andersonii.AAC.1
MCIRDSPRPPARQATVGALDCADALRGLEPRPAEPEGGPRSARADEPAELGGPDSSAMPQLTDPHA